MAQADDSLHALGDVVSRLSSFEPVEQPVLSLYLDTRAGQHGRDQYEPFLRKELAERGRTFGAGSREREAFERDAQRIREWLGRELGPSADGVAVFACSEAGLFEATQLDVPVEENRLVVGRQPFVYPLVQMIEQHPRYAALVADTNLARLYVFGLSTRLRAETVQSPKTKGDKVGGWSQMRFQRRIKDQYSKHAKEVVEVLARVVREERIDHVVLAGDEVVLPVLREQLPQELAAKVIDTLALDIRTPEREVLAQTLESLRRKDAESDSERVAEVFDEYRADGLALVGAAACLGALAIGQVHELLLTATPQALRWSRGGRSRGSRQQARDGRGRSGGRVGSRAGGDAAAGGNPSARSGPFRRARAPGGADGRDSEADRGPGVARVGRRRGGGPALPARSLERRAAGREADEQAHQGRPRDQGTRCAGRGAAGSGEDVVIGSREAAAGAGGPASRRNGGAARAEWVFGSPPTSKMRAAGRNSGRSRCGTRGADADNGRLRRSERITLKRLDS